MRCVCHAIAGSHGAHGQPWGQPFGAWAAGKADMSRRAEGDQPEAAPPARFRDIGAFPK